MHVGFVPSDQLGFWLVALWGWVIIWTVVGMNASEVTVRKIGARPTTLAIVGLVPAMTLTISAIVS